MKVVWGWSDDGGCVRVGMKYSVQEHVRYVFYVLTKFGNVRYSEPEAATRHDPVRTRWNSSAVL